MARRKYTAITPRLRAYCRDIVGAFADERTRIGRQIRQLQSDLVKHAGGEDATFESLPIATRLLIDRIVRTQLQLAALDEKMATGDEWTDHDSRTHAALVSRLRLMLTKDLGMQPFEPLPYDPYGFLAEDRQRKRGR